MSRGGKQGGVARRKVGGRPTLPTFLIVCEGEKTEPQYFRGFKIPSVEVVGAGKNTKSLVDEAIRRKDMSEARDHYWCVFDRDSFPAHNFNAALQRARSAGFNVAYSNEAFEIWYLLQKAACEGCGPRDRRPERGARPGGWGVSVRGA